MPWENLNSEPEPTPTGSTALTQGPQPEPEDDDPDKPKKKKPMTDEEREALFKDEKDAHEKLQADLAKCWSKRVITPGKVNGREMKAGDRVHVHVVGYLHKENGQVYESTRDRGVPMIIIANRGSLVPGLDLALLSCAVGERAIFTIQPVGGYGNRGYVDANGLRTVPGSCTLVFDVEVVSIADEEELWEMDFNTKMRYAREYRERGNTIFKNKYFQVANDEYEQGMRYLLFNPHPKEEEAPFINEGLAAVQLNLAACKLRIGREQEAIKHAEAVLQIIPEQPKAYYRIGQAHVQLGHYRQAENFLNKSKKASEGDEAAVASVNKELERLAARQERHKRGQKKAAVKMMKPKLSRYELLKEEVLKRKLAVPLGVVAASLVIALFVYI